jgi:hypothetical protein
LNGLSCPAANYCVTVGEVGSFFPPNSGKAAFAIYNGSTWKLYTEPKPPAGQGNGLTGIQGKPSVDTVHGLAGEVNGTTGTWQTIP